MAIQSKQALIDDIRHRRSRLEHTLGGLSPDKMVIPGVESDWSIKDVIAHLLFWEQRALFWLKAARDGFSDDDHTWNDSVDNLNAQNYEANKNRPLEDVLDEERSVFNTMLHLVEAASEDNLIKPGHFSWLKGDSLATRIP